MAGEEFKTTLMGGYDKDDVSARIQRIREKHNAEIGRINKELQNKDEEIEALERKIREKDEEKAFLEREIKEKYQKYVDYYESISRLLLEAEIRAKAIIDEANQKADAIVQSAKDTADAKIGTIQGEIDKRILEGKEAYQSTQKELAELLKLVDQVQSKFNTSYDEVQDVVKQLPESLFQVDQMAEKEIEELDHIDFDEIANEAIRRRAQQEEAPDKGNTGNLIQEAENSMRSIERKVRENLELGEGLDEEDDLTDEDIELFLTRRRVQKRNK